MSLWVGGAVAVIWKEWPWGRVGCLGLALWYVGGAIYTFPNFISYFNELAGGSQNGYRYAVDCNLDWGQDLKPLADYLHGKNVHMVYQFFW